MTAKGLTVPGPENEGPLFLEAVLPGGLNPDRASGGLLCAAFLPLRANGGLGGSSPWD